MSNEKQIDAERRQFWAGCMRDFMRDYLQDMFGADDLDIGKHTAKRAAEYADAALEQYDARWGE